MFWINITRCYIVLQINTTIFFVNHPIIFSYFIFKITCGRRFYIPPCMQREVMQCLIAFNYRWCELSYSSWHYNLWKKYVSQVTCHALIWWSSCFFFLFFFLSFFWGGRGFKFEYWNSSLCTLIILEEHMNDIMTRDGVS